MGVETIASETGVSIAVHVRVTWYVDGGQRMVMPASRMCIRG